MTQITRLPNSNLGIAVFSNDDTYGTQLVEIVKWRIVDEVFGLPLIDWSARYREEVKARFRQGSRRKLQPPSKSKRTPPTLPLREIVKGQYHNPAYGTLNFSLDDGALVAKWDKFWSSHIRLSHFNGDLFNVSLFDVRVCLHPVHPLLLIESSYIAYIGRSR